MSNNPPFPATDDFQRKSELYSIRDNPGAQDKTKVHDPVVPADASHTGIPILMLGKSREVGEMVAAFLRPEYLVQHHATSIDELLAELPNHSQNNLAPQAIYIGGGFTETEQDEVEKRVKELDSSSKDIRVLRSRPMPYPDIEEKYAQVSFPESAQFITKATLDKAGLHGVINQ